MRKIFVVFLIIMLLFSTVVTVYGSPGGPNGTGTPSDQPADRPNVFERIMAGIVVSVPNYIMKFLSLQDPATLIFGIVPDNMQPPPEYVPPEKLILHTFTEDQFKAVAMLYEAFRANLPVPLVVMLVILSLAAMYGTMAGGQRRNIKDYFQGIVVFFAVLMVAPTLLYYLFEINWYIVKLAAALTGDKLNGGFLNYMVQSGNESLGASLLTTLFSFAIGMLNFQYNVRLLCLGALIFLLPMAAFLSVFPSKRNALSAWMAQMMANLLTQSAHALVFAFVSMFMGSQPNVWLMVALFVGLNSITITIRRVLGGDGEGFGSAISAAFGMAAVGGLMRMGMSMMQYKGMKSTVKKETDDIEKLLRGGTTSFSPSYGGGYGAYGTSRYGSTLNISGRTINSGTDFSQASKTTEYADFAAGKDGVYNTNTSMPVKTASAMPALLQTKFRLDDKDGSKTAGHQAVAKVFRAAGTGLRIAGGIAGGYIGALTLGNLAGAAMDDTIAGVGAGAAGGAFAGAYLGDMAGDALDKIAEGLEQPVGENHRMEAIKQQFGIFDYGAQMMDPDAAAEIGRNILKGPGEVMFRAGSYINRAFNKESPEYKRAEMYRRTVDESALELKEIQRKKEEADQNIEIYARLKNVMELKGQKDTEQYKQINEKINQAQIERQKAELEQINRLWTLKQLQEQGFRPKAHYGINQARGLRNER